MFIALALTLTLLAMLPGTPLLRTVLSGQSTAQFQSEPGLSKGKFLVASRNLRDPAFFETVVLLIEYNRHGALGLIINRPTKLSLAKMLPEMKGIQQRTDTVYIGGPVAKRQMSLLIRSGNQPEGAHLVFEDIYMSSSRKVLQRMIEDAADGERFRVYAGYAGWAPAQLDQEVSRGGWHLFQADAETIFDKEPAEIWPELISRSSAQWVKIYLPVPALGPSAPKWFSPIGRLLVNEGHAHSSRRLY